MTTPTAMSILLTALTVAIDASAFLLVAWAIILANRGKSSLRHAVWVGAFLALLLLPVFLLTHRAAETISIAIHTVGSHSLSKPIQSGTYVATRITDWPATARLLVEIWASGATVLLVWIGLAVQGLRSLFRTSTPSKWREGEFERLAGHLKLRRHVALRISPAGAQLSALTWGVRRPVILLPSDAAAWTDEERESILLHELAHVQRWDSLYQFVAALATCVFWFHPAVWLAAWSMRCEAEEAADDAVLRSGVKPSDYASQLLVLATRYGNGRRARPSLGVFMMKKSGIERRVRSIVAPDRRRHGPTLTQVASIGVITFLVVFFVTNIRPVLRTVPDARDSLYEDVLFSATQHQRNSEIHRMAMIRQWGAKKAAEAGFRDVTSLAAKKSGPALLTSTKNSPALHHHLATPKTEGPRTNPTEANDPVATEAHLASTAPRAPLALMQPRPHAMALVAMVPVVPTVAALRVGPTSPPTARCSVQRFHAVVAGPEVALTLHVAKGQGYGVDCTNPKQPGVVVRKNGDEYDFGVGHDGDIDKEVTARVENGVLYLRGSCRLEVVTTTPSLDRLEVSGDSVVNCSGVSEKDFKVVATGHSTVEVNGHAAYFNLDLSGNSVLRGSNLAATHLTAGVSGNSAMELGGEFRYAALHAEADSSLRASGHVGHLDLTGLCGSSVDCSGLEAQDVGVAASNSAAIRVFAKKTLNASADHGSQIQYSGKPPRVRTAPDESSKIFF